ncbi:hypothetical protein EVAR_31628_1 [Eumeta japonica]|uniref:Uncharacterized protein n=1 Tax=Eumeta variegata TaxID=151549 RepID=A0A4C1W1Y1_EUMVA|nr:hypothetical protein EVAR_31628_1 [Eumeta japonica]
MPFAITANGTIGFLWSAPTHGAGSEDEFGESPWEIPFALNNSATCGRRAEGGRRLDKGINCRVDGDR